MRSFCILLILSCSLSAATYYVDPATGDDANAGTATETAWASVPGRVGTTGSGWVKLNAGDSLYVKGGSANNYQVLLNSTYFGGSISFDSIVISSGDEIAWGAGRAIFDQQNTRSYGFAFGPGSTGITLRRLEISNIKDGANAYAGNGSACIEMGNTNSKETNICIKDCYLHTAYGTTTDHGHGIEWYGPDTTSVCSSIVEGCVIENVRTKGIEIIGGTNNIIRNNFIQKTGDHGIVISGNYNDVYNNVINMIGTDAGIAETAPFVHNPVFALKINYSFNDVFNNLAFNSTGADGAEGFASHGRTNRFIHNTVGYFRQSNNWADNGANAFNIGFEQGENVADYNEVRNNIGVFCAPSSGQGQIFVWDQATNCLVQFNNFFSTNGTLTTVYGHSGAYNQWAASTFDSAALDNGIDASNNQSVDPSFVGGTLPTGLDAAFHPNSTYFSLQSGSIVKQTGNDLTSLPANGAQPSSKFSNDILGVTRVNWSMGAYEYMPPSTSARWLPFLYR